MTHDTGIERALSRPDQLLDDLTPDALADIETGSPGTDVGADPDEPTTSADVRGPYRSLVPFDTSDADLFFGRTELWRRLHVRAVPGGGPVTVLGPSGSGKTSLVRAGLIPAVERMGLRHNGTRVPAEVVAMTPGTTPVQTLTGLLGPEFAQADPTTWSAVIAGRPDRSAHLVVIDQAEELFTLCDRTTRSTFLTLVDALAADDRFAVVLTLQADFYARATADPVLVRTLEDRAIVVRAMTQDELIAAIAEPAGARGVTVESGLAADIAGDLTRIDAVTPPLVALGVLMDHLWRTRSGAEITTEAYRASEPVATIVGATADRAYTRLTVVDREIARLILLASVRFTDQGDLVASGVTVADLHRAMGTPARVDRVLQHLVDSTVLVVGTSGVPGGVGADADVRLIHESLTHAWPRLAGWIDERRRGTAVISALHTDAEAWEGDGRPDAALYDTARFRAASDAVETIDAVSPDADYFLQRSRERLSLRTSRRRVLLGLLIVVAVVALVVAITQVIRGGDSATDRDAAQLDATLARVGASTVTDPSAAAALALAAFRSAPDDPRTRSALLATQSSPIARSIGAPATSLAIAASGDGRRVALAGADGAVRVLASTSGVAAQTTTTIPTPDSPPEVRDAVAINEDGSLVARRGDGGAVELWRVSGRDASRVSTIAATAGDRVPGGGSIAFSAVRPWLAAADPTGSVRIWDVADPAIPTLLGTVRSASPTVVAWNPRLPQLLVGSGDKQVALWDLTDPRTPRTRGAAVGTAGAVDAVTVSRDGALAAVGDSSGTAALFDVGARGLNARGPGVPASSGGVDAVSIAPGGARLAVTSSDGTAQVWDITHPDTPRRSTAALRTQSSPIAAAVFTGTSTLASAGTGAPLSWSLPSGLLDGGFGGAYPPACSIARTACVTSFAAGPVQVWDATDPTAPKAIAAIDVPGHFGGATMSPDGLWMMTVDSRHQAQLWDVREIRKPVAIGAPLSLGAQRVDHMVFSPSSSMLATSTDDGRSVQVSDVSLGGLTPIATVDNGDAGVDAVAFGADSRSIALGGTDGAVRRWTLSDAGASQVSAVLPAGGPVTAIGALGSTVLVGNRSGTLTRWDQTGAQIGTGVPIGSSAITSIATIGSTVVVASADGRLHRLDAGAPTLDAGSLFGATGNGDSRIAVITPTTVIATGDTGREQFWSLDPASVAGRVCVVTGGENCR